MSVCAPGSVNVKRAFGVRWKLERSSGPSPVLVIVIVWVAAAAWTSTAPKSTSGPGVSESTPVVETPVSVSVRVGFDGQVAVHRQRRLHHAGAVRRIGAHGDLEQAARW